MKQVVMLTLRVSYFNAFGVTRSTNSPVTASSVRVL